MCILLLLLFLRRAVCLEYLTCEIIELSGNGANAGSLDTMLPYHIADAVFGDQELMDMLHPGIVNILDRSTEKFHYTFLEMQKEPQFYAKESNLVMAHNFARLLLQQGHTDKAEPVLMKVLNGREKELGCDHLDTLDTAKELGMLYLKKKEYGESERLIRKAVDGYEQWYEKDGKKKPSTLPVVHNQALLLLANILIMKGDLINAEIQYSKMLDNNTKNRKNIDEYSYDFNNRFVLSKLAELKKLKAKDRVSTRHEGRGGGGIQIVFRSGPI